MVLKLNLPLRNSNCISRLYSRGRLYSSVKNCLVTQSNAIETLCPLNKNLKSFYPLFNHKLHYFLRLKSSQRFTKRSPSVTEVRTSYFFQKNEKSWSVSELQSIAPPLPSGALTSRFLTATIFMKNFKRGLRAALVSYLLV